MTVSGEWSAKRRLIKVCIAEQASEIDKVHLCAWVCECVRKIWLIIITRVSLDLKALSVALVIIQLPCCALICGFASLIFSSPQLFL